MKVDVLADLLAFVNECADDAVEAAEGAGLAKFAEALVENSATPLRYAKSFNLSLVNHDEFQDKDLYFCEKSWATILSVDIRGSTRRAMEIGAQGTFITMHVFMRAMIRLVAKAKGLVVGLRGDGLLAAFGRKTFEDEDDLRVTTNESDHALLAATSCGDAMVRAVRNVVNPTLVKRDVPGDLRIGVGIECGRMIITKIGLLDAYDVTAYGPCVNRAAKISSEKANINKVVMGRDANKLFPSREGGRIKVRRFRTDMHLVEYPADANTLK
jgi:class 3 adenylate cyclase